jgi:UDP-N-acetylmuramate dehydrogenase
MTWKTQLPAVRGKLLVDEALAPFTWFRVGGPADVVFLPADEQDLAEFLKALDPAVPVLAIGVGSNLLVRDGGVEGVVIRLGKGFNTVEALGDNRIKAGSAVPDAILARKAADAGIAGLEFYAGIPGTIGGAVIMNAGCYGSETVNVVKSVRVMDRAGQVSELAVEDLHYTYRHSALQDGETRIVLDAVFEGTADDPSEIKSRTRSSRACAISPSAARPPNRSARRPAARRSRTRRATRRGSWWTRPAGAVGRTAGRCSARCIRTF